MKHISIVESLRRAVELRATVARLAPVTATARKGVPVAVTKSVEKLKPKASHPVILSAVQLAAIAAAWPAATATVTHAQPTEVQDVAASWERAMQRATSRKREG